MALRTLQKWPPLFPVERLSSCTLFGLSPDPLLHPFGTLMRPWSFVKLHQVRLNGAIFCDKKKIENFVKTLILINLFISLFLLLYSFHEFQNFLSLFYFENEKICEEYLEKKIKNKNKNWPGIGEVSASLRPLRFKFGDDSDLSSFPLFRGSRGPSTVIFIAFS